MFLKKKNILVWAVIFLIFPLFGRAAELGEIVNFKVVPSYDSRGRSETVAFLKKISQAAYFFVEQDFWNSLEQADKNNFDAALENLAQEFDHNIYPNATLLFGTEWKPGIDNDERISILLTSLRKNAGGYFNSGDEIFKTKNPNSNERELINLNASFLIHGRPKVFLAHEFQHLISFFQKEKRLNKNDDVWLNEVRSEYIPVFLNLEPVYRGSNFESRVRQFINDPSDSLTEWKDALSDYGSIAMFGYYLADRFGPAFFSDLMKSDKVGIESVNDVLIKNGYSQTFSDIFGDWTIANFLNTRSFDSGRYGYKNKNLIDFRVVPDFTLLVSSVPVTLNFSAKDWTPAWYKFIGAGQGILKLEFKSAGLNSKFKIPYIIQDASGQDTVKFFDLTQSADGQSGALYIKNFGPQIQSVIVSPFNQYKISDFTDNDPLINFSLTASIIVEMPVVQDIVVEPIISQPVLLPQILPEFPKLPDGSLVRAQGDYKVYIINGKYKRHILNPQIFNMYSHFQWSEIKELSNQEFNLYATSALVRADGDQKVYELNADGTKHWINMTAESFALSGRTWESIFLINNIERDFYKTGEDVR